MNSTFKSIGKFFPLLILVGCQTPNGSDEAAPSAQVRAELAGEVSLKSDRDELAQLRKEIPEEKRQANDELAVLLGVMGEVKLKPSEVQSRVQNIMHKRRDEFRKKVLKLREDFRKEEARRKEIFLKEQKSARDSFKADKRDKDKTKEFYAGQDVRRREFFANEADRRKDFESETKTQSADFDSYMREKQREFSEQARLYANRYYEMEKEKREAAKNPPKPIDPKPTEPGTAK